MYGVIFHDYMRDILNKEFITAFGETKEKAAEKAWKTLELQCTNDTKMLEFDNGRSVTKTSFIKEIINNENKEDGVFISKPYYIYVKLFEIPNPMMNVNDMNVNPEFLKAILDELKNIKNNLTSLQATVLEIALKQELPTKNQFKDTKVESEKDLRELKTAFNDYEKSRHATATFCKNKIRVLGCLDRAKVKTVEDLKMCDRKSLLLLRNFGTNAMAALNEFMEATNITIPDKKEK